MKICERYKKHKRMKEYAKEHGNYDLWKIYRVMPFLFNNSPKCRKCNVPWSFVEPCTSDEGTIPTGNGNRRIQHCVDCCTCQVCERERRGLGRYEIFLQGSDELSE